MCGTYREVYLAPDVFALLAEWLRGGATLCRKVLERTQLETGRALTFLPQGMSPPTVRFCKNGAPGLGRSVAADWAIAKTQAFLGLSLDKVVLFENECARPSDPWTQREKERLRVLFFEEEVYHILTGSDAEDRELIRTIMRQADKSGYRFVGIMSSLPDTGASRATRLEPNTIDVLADRVEQILFGAFDGSGYIIWSHLDIGN